MKARYSPAIEAGGWWRRASSSPQAHDGITRPPSPERCRRAPRARSPADLERGKAAGRHRGRSEPSMVIGLVPAWVAGAAGLCSIVPARPARAARLLASRRSACAPQRLLPRSERRGALRIGSTRSEPLLEQLSGAGGGDMSRVEVAPPNQPSANVASSAPARSAAHRRRPVPRDPATEPLRPRPPPGPDRTPHAAPETSSAEKAALSCAQRGASRGSGSPSPRSRSRRHECVRRLENRDRRR